MKTPVRHILDKTFTWLARLSVALLVLMLLLILCPIITKGFSAVVFRGTVEFRHMQFVEFSRGDEAIIREEINQVEEIRRHVYETIDNFKSGIDPSALTARARDIHSQFRDELKSKDTPRAEYRVLRGFSSEIRDKLEAAFTANDKDQITRYVEEVLQHSNDDRLKDTAASQYFTLAKNFLQSVQKIDFEKRQQYSQALSDMEQILFRSTQMPGLLGPRPEEPLPALSMFRYGATRWDVAQRLMHRLLWEEKWVEQESSDQLKMIEVPRAERFAGTDIEPLFGYVQENLERMLNPKWTFYWRYFFDDSTPGQYFGGVGPEIYGTLLLTLLSMVFVIPLGIISAAYLAECASEGRVIRTIRMCINTLAGVPSIVFGLFGLAFFVLFLVPLFGGPSKPCILAGSLTLAVLTLPVMIRASEEAIRTVPQSYKEASLALGAGHFRTFVIVTLPAALPGILTGIILSLSRVAGETAPILFTAGVAVGPPPTSVFHTTRTLSYGIWNMAVADNTSRLVPHNQYGMVVTLVALVLCLNTLAIILRARVFKKLKGR